LDEEGNSGEYAHIVGNGDSENNRSNAHTLDWSGNAWFAGSVTANGLVMADRATGIKYCLYIENGQLKME
jgi:hypothetical protein